MSKGNKPGKISLEPSKLLAAMMRQLDSEKRLE